MRRAARRLASAAVLSILSGCREIPRCNTCGTIITAVTADADALHPGFAHSNIGIQIGDVIFLKLADLGLGMNTLGDSGFQPRLARAWKFEDSITISFEMDPRARWHDGRPVTAEDVAFTFAVYRDPKAGSKDRPLLSEIASVTARDSATAVVRFRHPYAEQFYDATHHMRVLPRHLLDSIPPQRLASHLFMRQPVGNGPFRFVSWSANEAVEVTADSTFFLGRPGLARAIWKVTPSFETAITQLIAGEVDFVEFLGSPENVARAQAAPQLRIVKYMSAAYTYLGLNLWEPGELKHPNHLFGDRELRRALTQAVDRVALVRAVLGELGEPALGPTSRLTPTGNDTTLARLPFDTVAAQETLDRLGWKDADGDGIREKGGRKLEFQVIVPASSQVRQRMATLMQSQLGRLGVHMQPSVIELNLFNTRTRNRNFEAAIMTWNDDPTPSSIRQTWVSTAIGDANSVGYSDPGFDRLVNEAVYARDPKAAAAKWREALGIVIEDAPGIWIVNPVAAAGLHRRFENVTIRPDQWSATLWTWRIAPDRLIDRDRVAATSPRS